MRYPVRCLSGRRGSKRRIPAARSPKNAPQIVLVAMMLIHEIIRMGPEGGAASGGPSKNKLHMVCWSTIARAPYTPPATARVRAGFGTR